MSCRIVNGELKRALVVENPSPVLDDLLRAQGVDVLRLNSIPSENELIAIMQEHRSQVIFKRSKVSVSRKMIEQCPDLMMVQLCCIGDDSVDKQACADHGVIVCNDPVSNGRSVVELVFGNLIALSRRLFETNPECNQGIWGKNNTERYEILGKHIGIVGLGNIGRSVARVAQSFGMHVHFFDTREVSVELGKELGWQSHDSLEALFASVDCLTVHLSAQDVVGKSNEGILTLEHFRQFGRERPAGPRIFLNFARGFLFNPSILLQAISEGLVSRAAVDVYPHEPRTGEVWSNPYQAEDKVVVYPHIGASTQEAQPRIATRVSETFQLFSTIGGIRDTVFQPRLKLALSERGAEGQTWLMVCHSPVRGTKRCIDESIFNAGINNIASLHKDFPEYGWAYDLALLDKPLTPQQLAQLVVTASHLDPTTQVIRSVRQVSI